MSQPISVVTTRVVKPGHERDFDRWADEADAAAARAPGHQTSIRLHDAEGLNHLVYQFDTREHLEQWERSPRRRELMAQADVHSRRHSRSTDDEPGWFSVPSRATVPKWKLFLITWTCVYPLLLVASTVVNQLAGPLPNVVRLGITSLFMTCVITYLVLPRLTTRLRSWLH